jgi:hypothetical protein
MTAILTLYGPSEIILSCMCLIKGTKPSKPIISATYVIPWTTLSLTSLFSSFIKSMSTGRTLCYVTSFPMNCPISQMAWAHPALYWGVPSGYVFRIVGSKREVTLSTERNYKLSGMLLMAASFTSNSPSVRRTVKVWIRLLSVISFPNEWANSEKFFAKQSLTFQDLSSPAASRVPRVWI